MNLSKTALALGLLNFVGLVLLGYLSLRQPAIVYVDSTKILNEYEGMKSARMSYQQKSLTWKANIDTLVAEVQNDISKYTKSRATLTAKEKGLTEDLIRSKQKQLTNYQQALTEKARQEDQQMTEQVLTEVNAFIEKYGKQKGYTIVMAATAYGNIAYAEKGLDITEEVLAGLNKEYTGL
jgi:outer membrane protein